MKNTLIKILTLLMVLCFSLGTLFACSNGESGQTPPTNPPEHTHKYESEYTFDAEFHWFECECGDKKETKQHAFTDNKCACGYEKLDDNHVHNFSILKCDQNKHWYECSCGIKFSEEVHEFDKQEESEKYLASEATCQHAIQYNYSCECGARGVKTFESGSVVAHSYENNKCIWCSSDEIYSKGLKFVLINNDTEYEVSVGTCTDKEVIIPSVYEGKPVTSIGAGAFSSCESLESIEIPNSVTNIGIEAFGFCDSLKYNVKDGIKYLGNSNNKYLYLAGLESNGVTSLNIDINCKIIGSYALQGLGEVPKIEIPLGMLSIGYAAFAYTKIGEIKLPDTITNIGPCAFFYCDSLKCNVYEGVKYLPSDNNPYYAAVDIVDVNRCNYVLHSDVEVISDALFMYCESTNSVEIDSNNKNYKTIDGNLYSKDGKVLIQYAIGKTANSFSIPNGVETIGIFAFYSCDSLKSIEIPGSVTSIGILAFFCCESLTSIEFNGTVSEWDNITKGENWDESVPATEVICTDGKASLT